jgi:hypothetical protein
MARCRFEYSVYQAEHSRDLLFSEGAVMDEALERVCERARQRLDVPRLKALSGAKRRPQRDRKNPATISAVAGPRATASPGSSSPSGGSA